MNRPSSTLTYILIAIALLAIHVPKQAEAGIDVVDRELVSKQRVGPATEYTYRLSVEVDGPALDDVRVFVRCDSAVATVVTEGTQPGVGRVDFGDIPGNATTVSTDTFTLRLEGQSREAQFDPDCLDYDIGFTETLIISGVATDMPLSGALIIGTITRPDSGRPVIVDSGRPVIESFETTADENGAYTLEMEVISGSDFITLEAQGTDEGTMDQSEALLTSTVGSVDSLHSVGTEGSIIVGTDDAGALDITHITTALDELVRRLNGGVVPESDGELAALQAQVDGAELLELATLIKTIVDNPNVPLPPGFNNTLELIQNPGAAAAALEDVQMTFPDEYQQALEETASTLNLGFDEAEVIGITYLIKPTEVPFDSGGIIFNLDPNFGGFITNSEGTVPVTWQIDNEGNLVAEVTDPILTESFEVLDPPGVQVRVLSGVTRYTMIRIADGIESDQVMLLTRLTRTFPDNPGIPTEFIDSTPGPDAVYLAARDDFFVPVDPADITNNTIALYYHHQDNHSVGLSVDDQLGSDFLTFNANGTGSTARRAFGFVWSIESDGALLIVFDNGDSNRYFQYEEGDVPKAVVIGALGNGDIRSVAGEAIEFGGVQFSEATLLNRRFRQLGSVVDPEFDFSFVFLPNGEGCRRIDGFSRPMTWDFLPNGVVDTLLYLTDGSVYQRRSWQIIDVLPGTVGDRYWLVETLDIVFGGPFVDPQVTPGRINAYENEEDVTGQSNPCSFVQNTLSTAYNSDNGGVGNLFDLTVDPNSAAVRVLAFDINVSLPIATDFDVTVYTRSGTFEDTVTPGVPGCPLLAECVDISLWSLHSTVQATSAGQDNPTLVDLPNWLTIIPGETTGVWITLARDGVIFDEMRYTNANGPVVINDGKLEITTGSGVTFGPVDRVFPNRTWNGTVYYETDF